MQLRRRRRLQRRLAPGLEEVRRHRRQQRPRVRRRLFRRFAQHLQPRQPVHGDPLRAQQEELSEERHRAALAVGFHLLEQRMIRAQAQLHQQLAVHVQVAHMRRRVERRFQRLAHPLRLAVGQQRREHAQRLPQPPDGDAEVMHFVFSAALERQLDLPAKRLHARPQRRPGMRRQRHRCRATARIPLP